MKQTLNIMVLAIFLLLLSLILVVSYPDLAQKLSLALGLTSGFLMLFAYMRLVKLTKKR